MILHVAQERERDSEKKRERERDKIIYELIQNIIRVNSELSANLFHSTCLLFRVSLITSNAVLNGFVVKLRINKYIHSLCARCTSHFAPKLRNAFPQRNPINFGKVYANIFKIKAAPHNFIIRVVYVHALTVLFKLR